MKFALILTFVLLSTYQVYSQDFTVIDTERVTLEDFLNVTIEDTECRSVEIIEAEQTRVLSWIDVLSNPDQLREDIAVLDEVYALIERARASIEASYDEIEVVVVEEVPEPEGDVIPVAEAEGEGEVSGNIEEPAQLVFAQIKSYKQALQQFQDAHHLYQEEMKDIMSMVETFSTQEGSDEAELLALADEILSAITKLSHSIEGLLAQESEFSAFQVVLQERQAQLSVEYTRCHEVVVVPDAPVPDAPAPDAADDDDDDGGNTDGGDGQGQEIGGIITPNGEDPVDPTPAGNNLSQSDFTVKSGQLSGPASLEEDQPVLVAKTHHKKHHKKQNKNKKSNKKAHKKAHKKAVDNLNEKDNKAKKHHKKNNDKSAKSIKNTHHKNLRNQKKHKKAF